MLLNIPPSNNTASERSREYQKLEKFHANNWAKFANKHPFPRKALEEHNHLLHCDDEVLAQRAADFQTATDRMSKCSIPKPCRVPGCCRCGQMTNFELASKTAAIVNAYTSARKGHAIAITLTSDAWVGPARETALTVRRHMSLIQSTMKDLLGVSGFQFNMDASLYQLKNVKVGSVDVLKPMRLSFDIHIHGTVLTTGNRDTLYNKLDAMFTSLGLPIEVHLENIRGSFVDGRGKKRSNIISAGDAAGWIAYSNKLHHGGQQRPVIQRLLQRELFNIQRHWSGGVLQLTKNDEPHAESIEARESELREYQDLLKAAHADVYVQLEPYFVEADTLIKRLKAAEDRRTKADDQVNRRRTDAYKKYRSIYSPSRFSDAWAKRKEASKRRKQEAAQRSKEQIEAVRTDHKQLRKLCFRIFKRSVQLISSTPRNAAALFHSVILEQRQDKQKRVPAVMACVSIGANILAIRKRLLHKSRLAGAGIDTLSNTKSYEQLKLQLVRLDEFWPALDLQERRGQPLSSTFWARWQNFLYQLI